MQRGLYRGTKTAAVGPFAPAGFQGATAPSRYVGATTSGAPTTGTFAVGDYVIDQTGIVWVCTAAGSPGTWVDASSSGKELGYAEITSPPTTVTAVLASAVAVTGLSISPTIRTRPIMFEFGCSGLYNNTATKSVGIVLTVDGTNTGVMCVHTSATANAFGAICTRRRLSLSAGAHTLAIKWYVDANTGAMLAGDGTANNQKPAYVAAYEC